MLPAGLVAYLIVSAVLALLGAWYVKGGTHALAVAFMTATIPYWILLHVFDPGAVIYFTQSLFATSAAMWAGTVTAPQPRVAAGWMFGIFLFLAGTIAVAALYESAQFSDARPYWQVVVGLLIQTVTAWYVVSAVRKAAAGSTPALTPATVDTEPQPTDLMAALRESVEKAKATENHARQD